MTDHKGRPIKYWGGKADGPEPIGKTQFITYKGYTAQIYYSPADQVYYGKISGILDLVSFEADQADKIESAFIEAVEDYLETCAKVGKNPDKDICGEKWLNGEYDK